MTIYLIYSGGGYDFVGFRSSLSGAIDFVRRRLTESKRSYSKDELRSLEEFNEEYLKTGEEEIYLGNEWEIRKAIELEDDDFKDLF